MEPADIARLVDVSDPAVAPDGRSVAVTVGRIDLAANRTTSAVWLVPADGGPARQITAGPGDSQGRFSPDGTRLAFVRTTWPTDGREPTTALLVLPLVGPGEAVTVATAPEGISGVDWSPDGERLAWTARVRDEGAADPDRDREPRRIESLFTTLDSTGWTVDRRAQVHVGRVDGTEPPRPVTDGPWDHGEPRWTPDGRHLLVSAGRHPTWDVDSVTDLWLVDPDGVAGTTPRRVTDGTRAWWGPAWSPDGTRIAALSTDPSNGPRNARVLVLDPATGSTTDVAPAIDRTFAPYPGDPTPVWLDDATLLVVREDRGRTGVLRVAADAGRAPVEVVGGSRVVTAFDARGGTIACTSSDLATLAELSVLVDGEERRLTRFGEVFRRACPPRPVERFTVPSPVGDGDVDVWFVHPAGWEVAGAGSRWPLLVSIHGGPTTQYGDRWFDEFQLWASAGFAVVGCNPHGSSGREESWARSIRSPLAPVDPGSGWGGVDADDVLAVLEATLARFPTLDRARVGVLGGSYGGYLASWLLARSDAFAAGCSERAVNNLLSADWSTDAKRGLATDLGIADVAIDDAARTAELLRMSPTTYARDLTAPILILHSEDDLRCNVEQADALYVPLRVLGRDVEYWRFPGESHELSRSGAPRHRVRRAELILDFFRRRLGGPEPAAPVSGG